MKKRIMRRLIQMGDGIYDMVFPPRCIVCDGLLEQGQGHLHEGCKKLLTPAEGAMCMHCGRPLAGEGMEFCHDCARDLKNKKAGRDTFRQGKALYLYTGQMKQTMYRFKYENRREYASAFAAEAVRRYGEWLFRTEADAVIPVPMYRGKQRKRGYNQAAVFAKRLTEVWEGEKQPVYDAKSVIRVKNTRPMKELNGIERKNNLKNAFQTTQSIVKYNRVLLVDDIYTTGSTADAVSKELYLAGIGDVYVLSICIGKGV